MTVTDAQWHNLTSDHLRQVGEAAAFERAAPPSSSPYTRTPA